MWEQFVSPKRQRSCTGRNGVTPQKIVLLILTTLKRISQRTERRSWLFVLNPSKTEFILLNIQKFGSYLTGNTLRHRYEAQPVKVVWGNSRCLLWEPYGTHKYTVCRMKNSYLTGNTLRNRYNPQPVNAVWGNSRCLLWKPYGTHRYTLWAECRVLIYTGPVRTSQETHHVTATTPNRLILLRETVAVYCENHTEHTDTLCAECRVLVC
jgi:hypothetical protein